MYGFLVVNHYLHGKKYDDLHGHLLCCAKNMGIDLRLVTNQDAVFVDENPDFVREKPVSEPSSFFFPKFLKNGMLIFFISSLRFPRFCRYRFPTA